MVQGSERGCVAALRVDGSHRSFAGRHSHRYSVTANPALHSRAPIVSFPSLPHSMASANMVGVYVTVITTPIARRVAENTGRMRYRIQ